MQDRDQDIRAGVGNEDGSSGAISNDQTSATAATPVRRSGPERRLHLRAYEAWYNLLRGRLFPTISDFGKEGLATFRDNSFLIDFDHASGAPKLRFIGDAVAGESSDLRGYLGQSAHTLPDESLLGRLLSHYREVLAHRAPAAFEAEYENPRGKETLYRGILLPFSDDNNHIHFILGVVGWKEVGSPATRQGAKSRPSGVSGTLAAVLEEGRAVAGAVRHVDSRSRESLYEALALALGLYEQSLLDRGSYEQLLAQAGIREQARAPFTPAIKLVFGAGYDKTRITEYATALAYAHRLGVESSELRSFLMLHEGGIKGCVRQERLSRRASRGDVAPGGSSDVEEALSGAAALASVEIGALRSEGQYVLLLGRKREDGKSVDIISELEEKPERLGTILRRVAEEISAAEAGNTTGIEIDGDELD